MLTLTISSFNLTLLPEVINELIEDQIVYRHYIVDDVPILRNNASFSDYYSLNDGDKLILFLEDRKKPIELKVYWDGGLAAGTWGTHVGIELVDGKMVCNFLTEEIWPEGFPNKIKAFWNSLTSK